MSQADRQSGREGYAAVVPFEDGDYHVVGVYEDEEEWIDYTMPIDSTPVSQRDSVNVLLGLRDLGVQYLESGGSE